MIELPNISIIAARLRGRKTLVRERRAKLAYTARIINMRSDNSAISVGSDTLIAGELLTFAHGGEIIFGRMGYLGVGSRIWSACSVRIGNYVLIAHNVDIVDNLTHPIDRLARRQHAEAILTRGHPADIDLGERPVTIQDDVWIAAGAAILRGVTIGTGAIVGARSVVTMDVPPFTIVAGNPARVVRELDAEDHERKVEGAL